MFIFSEDPDDDESGKKGAPKEEDKSAFDWKNKGIGTDEKLKLKIDVREANLYDAKKNATHAKKNPLQNLPKGINTIRKKIKDVYDEDEDEEEWGVVVRRAPEDYDNTLMRALDEKEKRSLTQQQELKNVKLNQIAGRMEALTVADRMAKDVGLKGLKKNDVSLSMLEATFNPEKMQQNIIKKDILKEKGIKGDVAVKDIIQTTRGIKRIEKNLGKDALQDMNTKEVANLGKEKVSENDMAKLISKKRGIDNETAKKIAAKQNDNVDMKFMQGNEKKPKQKQKKLEPEMSRYIANERQHQREHTRG